MVFFFFPAHYKIAISFLEIETDLYQDFKLQLLPLNVAFLEK